jgi:hypothetical protein
MAWRRLTGTFLAANIANGALAAQAIRREREMAQVGTFDGVTRGDASADTRARWTQLLLGFIVMMAISSPQYVWTLFVPSFQKTTSALLSDVQWTITILIVLQTWLSPLQGYLVERLGPKLLWPPLRRRHRHCLYRRHRPDGEMVPAAARLRHRGGGGRLWVRRHPDHLPDRRHDESERL